ncbi:unnamed protein product [Nippostrongylus brasiliensis]|uniref:HTH_48 domain-containing protein n=1 Tax=Nippostrongylus brasiliensis TaxID=27835 RepID=A0A0N4Y6P2_NIPBR|nr:unnamed protein product [Nippostrongylus brasiliensis]
MAPEFILSESLIRNVILFLFLSGQNASQSFGRLKDVYKEEAPVRGIAYSWFSKFSSGDYNIENKGVASRSNSIGQGARWSWIWTY